MAQVRTDAVGAGAASEPAAPGAKRARPLSPHLQVWRWHPTMAASIATRATGMALYVGAIVAVAWALCLAGGEESYAQFSAVAGSLLGKLVLFGITVSLFYHLAAGVRHLVWDSVTPGSFQPRTADMTAIACFAFGVVAAVAVWAIAFSTGAA